MRSKRVRALKYAIPLSAGLVFGLLSLLPAWRTVEYAVYDFFLHLKPEPALAPSLYLLDVDDTAIDRVGMWPWPRSYMADGLVSLRELGASQAVFDIEYVDKSAAGIDYGYFGKDLKTEFDLSFHDMESGWADLMNGLASGSMGLGAASEFSSQIIDYMDSERDSLYADVGRVALDNDAELGKAMRLFGDTWTTLRFLSPADVAAQGAPGPDELKAASLAAGRFSLSSFGGSQRLPPYPAASYPIAPVLENSRGIGFTNVEVDPDGKRRRIALFGRVGEAAYPQLMMAPLLERMGNPRVELRRSSVKLSGALMPDGKREDVVIPLDDSGCMLINWSKGDYATSFPRRHISFDKIVSLREGERNLGALLAAASGDGAWSAYRGENPLKPALDAWIGAEDLRRKALDSGDEADRGAYLSAKEAAVAALSGLAASAWDAAPAAALEKLASSAADASAAQALRDAAAKLSSERRDLAASVSALAELRSALSVLKGATCIIGWTSSGTTDMGANPYTKNYVNVGTQAAVANTVLSRSFIREAPAWVSALLCVGLSLLFLFGKRFKRPLFQSIFGIAIVLASVAASLAVFLAFSVYVAPVAIAASLLVGSLGYSFIVFFMEEQEKSFLRKAFGTYLSGAVIDQIVADPGQLKLGGQRRLMTALFTDVKGFSTISEKLDAERLVSLLNRYLSTMSDIVLERQGTIDKYEGDAIMAFFGAPLDLPSHASAALGSAIMMKRAERILNEAVIAEGASPAPLLTRIGVNTGEMVVGNMGTERKMDYTIMGAAVNLASRLEGVNKQYGTWIMASDETVSEAGNEFLCRRMDRVRVVGVSTPVQLWEVLDFWADADEAAKALVKAFHEVRISFEERDWEKARAGFLEIQRRWPEDGPTKAYLRRCEDYLAGKAPPATWDGVFNLTEK